MFRRLHLNASGACLLLVGIMALPVNADPTIVYGTAEGANRIISLASNQSNQSVSFFVTGLSEMGGADGFTFDLQIRDGGTINGGTATGPLLGSIDMITNTIWANSVPMQTNDFESPLLKQSTVSTSSVVVANGLVATVNFDTTGFNTGDYAFRISGTGDGTVNSRFFRGTTILTTVAPNGFIRITAIPEPSVLLPLCSLLGLAISRRKRFFSESHPV